MVRCSKLLKLFPAVLLTLALACTQAAPANTGNGTREPTAVPENTGRDTQVASPASMLQVEGPPTTVEVVHQLTPSVVQVATESITAGFFNQPVPSRGVGTGLILDEDGHILTNNHVIAGAQSIIVTLSNGESFEAEIIGGDAATDTSVIRIEADVLQPAVLGNSSQLQVGEDVIAVGHALGLRGGPTVSKGVVSALGRSIDTGPQTTMVDLIQTDAAINLGNSGGPLVNSRGEVVGINTAIVSESQGIGFAININEARQVSAHLIERGFVLRGFLGISPVNLPPGAANQLNVPVAEGVLVAQVVPGSAAAEGGLRQEDVIVEMNSEPIWNTGELSHFLLTHPPGEQITITFFRGPEKMTIEVELGEPPQQP